MATATVTWPASAGATSYKVEYKLSSVGPGGWIIVNAAETLLTETITGLDPGTNYDFRVTSNCTAGSSGGTVVSNPTPCDVTINIKDEYQVIAPTNNSDDVSRAVNRTNTAYGTSGTRIYPINGYNIDGSILGGYSTSNITGASFWNNPTAINGAGKLNANAIWLSNSCIGSPVFNDYCTNEWVGFTYDYYAPVGGKTLYIGIGGKDLYRIIINGVTIVSLSSTLSTNYTWWNIYPVQLNHGLNIIYLMGLNKLGSSLPSYGAEIYDNTQSQLLAAGSNADLNILYSTSQDFCNLFPIGTNLIGKSCAPGYNYCKTTGNCIKKI